MYGSLVGPPGLEPGTNGFTFVTAFPPRADYLTTLSQPVQTLLGCGTL